MFEMVNMPSLVFQRARAEFLNREFKEALDDLKSIRHFLEAFDDEGYIYKELKDILEFASKTDSLGLYYWDRGKWLFQRIEDELKVSGLYD